MRGLRLLALAAAMLTGALAAAAAAGRDCDEQSFSPEDPGLRQGRVIGPLPPRAYFDGTRPGCPETTAACSGMAALAPGEPALLGKARAGYVCALFADGAAARAGWLPRQAVAGSPRPLGPAPPLPDWLGTWRAYDNSIALTARGGRIAAAGEAYWPGKNIMPANEGAFSGSAAPAGRRLHIKDDICEVDMRLAGNFLFVEDNRMCGGRNVSFRGIFIRRPDAPR